MEPSDYPKKLVSLRHVLRSTKILKILWFLSVVKLEIEIQNIILEIMESELQHASQNLCKKHAWMSDTTLSNCCSTRLSKVVILKTLFGHRWNLHLNHVVAGSFLIRQRANTGQHLTLQTGSNKATNEGMNLSVCPTNEWQPIRFIKTHHCKRYQIKWAFQWFILLKWKSIKILFG